MRKTKIICTIGPACADEKTLTKMCEAGMNVARLNFSHGTHQEHKEKIDLVKRVREKLNLPIAIMLDTKGPEYRIGTFKDGKIMLKEGDEFTFTTEDVEGDFKGDYFANEIDHFIDCVRNDKTPSSNITQAVQLQRMLMGIYESSRAGHEIVFED